MVTSSPVDVTGLRLFAKKGNAIGQTGISLTFNRAEDVVRDGCDFLRPEKNTGLRNVHGLEVFTGQAIALGRAVRGIGVAERSKASQFQGGRISRSP